MHAGTAYCFGEPLLQLCYHAICPICTALGQECGFSSFQHDAPCLEDGNKAGSCFIITEFMAGTAAVAL